MKRNWLRFADTVLEGHVVSRNEAHEIVESSDDEFLEILAAAFKLRLHFHGRKVRVHVLQNAKSGACSEDCRFCSQSSRYDKNAERHPMQQVEELVLGAKAAFEKGAVTYCMVTAARGPNHRQMDVICEAARRIKEKYSLQVCASLGMLRAGQAERLRAAGVDRYNHNLETSKHNFKNVVTTHSFSDRIETIRLAKAAGLEACVGGIIGMGESTADRVDLAFTLRELEVNSVPINFLHPRRGTPIGDKVLAQNQKTRSTHLRPQDALKTLAMFRFVNPSLDLRAAGGREIILGSMQPFLLYVANSIFTNGYLTTGGQGESADYQMIIQAGFVPEVVEQ